jgi:hypothetical protein
VLQALLAAVLPLRPTCTVAHPERGIVHKTGSRRVHSVDPDDRNASGLGTENLMVAANLNKLDKHANQKEGRNAEY